MMRTLPAFLSLLLLVACAAPQGAKPCPEVSAHLNGHVGQWVTAVGVAEGHKIGAAVHGVDAVVYIDGLHDWPPGVRGRRVRVTGQLVERHDLPVFISKEDALKIQGIPVSPGTNLHDASRRLVFKNAIWQVVNTSH